MIRPLAIFGAGSIAFLVASSAAGAGPANQPTASGDQSSSGAPTDTTSATTESQVLRKLRQQAAERYARDRRRSAAARYAARTRSTPSAANSPDDSEMETVTEDQLSDLEEHARQLAWRNGDQNFIMVDKALGKIILFEGGLPTYTGSALTGRSTSDELPPNALSQTFAQLSAETTKITPAGRFTVTFGYNAEYGTLLDVNEMHGKDWGIAIHQVWLGDPAEHRAQRLQSSREADKHITFGCINVAPATIEALTQQFPKDQSIPLYILPQDGTRTDTLFMAGNS